MKKSIIIFLSLSLLSSCIKMPVNNSIIISSVNYSFKGGGDLLSVFDIVSSYTGSDGDMHHVNITQLPWNLTETLIPPCDATLIISFSKKDDIPDQDFYYLGFSSEITYTNNSSYSYTTKDSEGHISDTLRFCIDFHDSAKAENAELSIPSLKYNKHFAFSYTGDDSVEGAYARLWRRINKRWIDDTEFFHKRCAPTTGYYPENTLGFTDGCGNERRFPVGVAIWPNVYNEYQPDGFIEESTSSTYSPYITWEELEDILDFGGSVYYHNVDELQYDKTNPDELLLGIEADRIKTLNRLGRSMKIMSQPDGNKAYLSAAESCPEIVMIRTDDNSPKINLSEISSLYKKRLYNGFTENRSGQLVEMEAESTSDYPYWLSFSTHRVDETIIPLFEEINRLYGKDGKDDIWFTTLDEVYEYVTIRENAIISKTVSGSKAFFEVIIPTENNFYYKDISFICNQSSAGHTLEPLSDNIYGAFSNNNDGPLLININYNPKTILLAEKYTSKFEESFTTQDKEDAIYFTTFLSPELAAVYLTRIQNVNTNPVSITSVSINNDEKYLFTRALNISIKYKNIATHYKVWEGNGESDSEWELLSSNPIPFLLSEGYGEKTINIKLKNQSSESNTVSKTILYYPEPNEGTITKDKIQDYLNQYDSYQLTKTITIPNTL